MRQIILTSAAALLLSAVAPPEAGASAAPSRTPASSAARDTGQLVLPRPKAGRARPLVVVVADNAGAETTDFVIPYGVLKESALADVRSLSTREGPARLFLSLAIRADQTLAGFDKAEPAGADIVIVPAQLHAKDPVLANWLRSQAARGATIVSICEGARVLAAAGLLDGRRATTHWHALPDLQKHYPRTTWMRDRRYVQDGPIISTTGVSASIPVSLALIEAIGGRSAAAAVASRLGASGWSAEHRTADYRLSTADYASVLLAIGSFWRRETVQAPITNGVDEIALALQADAWSRTFRANVVTTNPRQARVRSRRGLIFVTAQTPKPGARSLTLQSGAPLHQLDLAVAGVRQHYGWRAARLSMLGMEYTPAPPQGLSAAPKSWARQRRTTIMIDAVEVARLGCATLFLAGLVTGVWKYRAMITSANGEAPVYVDICHRAALMYAFACLILGQFAEHSAWPDRVNIAAVGLPVLFFMSAVAIYAAHGVLQDTDNQLRRPHRLGAHRVHGRTITLYMYLLSAGEIGGFVVLLAGHLRTLTP